MHLPPPQHFGIPSSFIVAHKGFTVSPCCCCKFETKEKKPFFLLLSCSVLVAWNSTFGFSSVFVTCRKFPTCFSVFICCILFFGQQKLFFLYFQFYVLFQGLLPRFVLSLSYIQPKMSIKIALFSLLVFLVVGFCEDGLLLNNFIITNSFSLTASSTSIFSASTCSFS